MNSQKLSLTLNVVLLIAVLYLFFKVSSLSSAVSGHHGETSVNSGNNPKDTGVKVNRVHEEDGQLVIRYVDIDSLNSQYELLKDAEKEFQALNKQAEAQYKGKIQAAQKRAQEIEKEFQFMTLSQQKAAQEEMARMEKDIQMSEQRIFGPVQDKFTVRKNEIDRTVKNYLREYCVKNNIDFILGQMSAVNFLMYSNPSMDITEEIIAGLNTEYAESKK